MKLKSWKYQTNMVWKYTFQICFPKEMIAYMVLLLKMIELASIHRIRQVIQVINNKCNQT